jgi:tetratricopeptide (TPR) repeat protein
MKTRSSILMMLATLSLAHPVIAAPSPTPIAPSPTLAPQQRQEVEKILEAELEKNSKVSDRVQATVNNNFGWAINLLTALIAVIGMMPVVIGVLVWLLRGGIIQQIVAETKKQIATDIEKEVKDQLHTQVSLELEQQVQAFRQEISGLKTDFLGQLQNLFLSAQQEKEKIFTELSRITPSVIQEEFVTPEVQTKIQELTKQLELLKTSTTQLWLTAEDYIHQGDALYFESRYDEAIASYDKALQLNNDLFGAWLGKAKALRRAQHFEQALAAHDKAIQLKPDGYWGWFGRGYTLSDLQRYEEALVAFTQTTQVNPNRHSAWKHRGYILSKLGRYTEAQMDFAKALALKPNSSGTHLMMARSYMMQNQVDLALAALQEAIAFDPKHREHAQTEPDFDPIRNDRRFQTLVMTSP